MTAATRALRSGNRCARRMVILSQYSDESVQLPTVVLKAYGILLGKLSINTYDHFTDSINTTVTFSQDFAL